MAEGPPPPRDADVLVDVELEHGLLWLALVNLGELPAHRRRIRTILDRPSLLFARDEPTRFRATATWVTDAGRHGRRVVEHDLEIYRDLAVLDPEVPPRAQA